MKKADRGRKTVLRDLPNGEESEAMEAEKCFLAIRRCFSEIMGDTVQSLAVSMENEAAGKKMKSWRLSGTTK